MTQRQFGWSAFRFWLSRQNPMFGLLIATAIIAVLFVLGLAVHALVWVALVALAIWLVMALVLPHGRGRRRYSS